MHGPPPWLLMAEEETYDRAHRAMHNLPIYRVDTLYFCTYRTAVLAQRLLRPSTYNHSIKPAERAEREHGGSQRTSYSSLQSSSLCVPWIVSLRSRMGTSGSS